MKQFLCNNGNAYQCNSECSTEEHHFMNILQNRISDGGDSAVIEQWIGE